MPGLDPASTFLLSFQREDVDGRDKPTAVRFDFYGQGAWR
jgi:hypothetical protein